MAPELVDISSFESVAGVFDNLACVLVVKSLNQSERRASMLAGRKAGRFGRYKPRETSIGLLARGRLENGKFEEKWTKQYREPRHIVRHGDGYFLTDISRVVKLDSDFAEVSSFSDPFFGFLHSIELSPNKQRLLVVSSGYDRVFELDITASEMKVARCWVGWDHGFNPTVEGVWLTDDVEKANLLLSEGKEVNLISPEKYGEQGLLTSTRTVHPNVAVYDIYEGEDRIIVSIGRTGHLYSVNLATGESTQVCSELGQMPHGIMPHSNTWVVTDTTRGRWSVLDNDFHVTRTYDLSGLSGKPEEIGDAEWVQKCIPHENGFIALDANRGIIAVDLHNETYTVYATDPEWCIQDIIPL